MRVSDLFNQLSQFDPNDNLVLYFLQNEELKSCYLESLFDANYDDGEGNSHIELTLEEVS